MKTHVENTGKSIDGVVAFTVFTPQKPVSLGEPIKTTLDRIDDASVEASVTHIEQLRECPDSDRDSGVEAFATSVDVPDFLTGNAPYLFSGGNIIITGDAAEIQTTVPLTYLIKIPCDDIPDQGFPLVIRGESTFDHWNQYSYQSVQGDAFSNKGIIEIIVDAPLSEERRQPSSINRIKDLFNLGQNRSISGLDMYLGFFLLLKIMK